MREWAPVLARESFRPAMKSTGRSFLPRPDDHSPRQSTSRAARCGKPSSHHRWTTTAGLLWVLVSRRWFSFPGFLSVTAAKQTSKPFTAPPHSAKKTSKSLYQTLGVAKTASNDEIRKAYRQAALKNHPDKGGDEETFKEISRAHEVLSDPERRKMYDQYGEAGLDPHVQPGPGFFRSSSKRPAGGGGPFPFSSSSAGQSDDSTFRSFSFGGSNNAGSFFGRSSGSPSPDLSDFFRHMMGMGGTTAGSAPDDLFGAFSSTPPTAGQKGSGSPLHQPLELKIPCSLEELYLGSTKKFKVNFRGSSRTYTVQLKPGWKEGTKIKFSAQGTSFPPVHLTVQQKKHPHWRRSGDDLIYRYSLSSSSSSTPKRRTTTTLDAADTVQVEIRLLDGTTWSRRLPASSPFLKPGRTLTVPDLGMPIPGTNQRGQMMIEFVP